MKLFKVFALILMLTLLLTLTVGCKKSADQKLKDAQMNEVAVDQDAMDAQAKVNAVNDWEQYKAAALVKIVANEKIIADYKVSMTNSSGKLLASYNKKIDALELKNKELKVKLNDYKDDGKSSWEKFKGELDVDMDNLGTSLKDFTVRSK